MRDLSDDYKTSFRAIEEVDEAIGTLVARMKADRKIRYRMHEAKPAKPGKAAVLCALVLWLDSRPEGEQKRIVAEGLAVLDRCLALDAPAREVADDRVEADPPEYHLPPGQESRGRKRQGGAGPGGGA